MKNLSLLFLLLSIFVSCKPAAQESSTEINWVSLEEAQAMTAKAPRKILVDVYTPWCGPCKKMDKQTFKDPDVIQYINQNFYAVKFNAESSEAVDFKGKAFANPNYDATRNKMARNSPHELTRFLNIRAYPTLVLLDEELEVTERLKGYKTVEKLLLELQQAEQRVAQQNHHR